MPDSVTSQMGSGFAGVGKMMSDQSQTPDQGGQGGGPTGALAAQANTVKKVLTQMAQGAQAGKKFFAAAIQMIDQGVTAESSAGSGTGSASQESLAPPPSFPG